MSDASVVFLPWVRQGLAARIASTDPVTSPPPSRASLGVAIAVNGVEAAPVDVQLFGPADVTGIDPRQAVRTEPPAGTTDYESNDLAAIEFDNPDLPWLFTPAAADAQGRVRPWLVLVVVQQQDGVRLRPPRTELLPVLEIGAPAVPSRELPDLADSWAWAHAQLGWETGATEDALRTVLTTRPELSVSRLLSPRLLEENTAYIACVVPAFEVGRLAGMGEKPTVGDVLEPAWKSGANAPLSVKLPVYYHWEFRTGTREDFESIVARLAPRDFSDVVGRRPMDIASPGFVVPPTVPPVEIAPVMLEGALQPVRAPRAPFPDGATKNWQQKLESILNATGAGMLNTTGEPVLGPPIYGRYYAGRHQIGTGQQTTWLDELNLDPRERVVAALGTRVIQEHQEELMAEAWDQAGRMADVNRRMRQLQLSLAITTRLHARHVQRIDDDDTLWRFASPAQSRLVIAKPSNAAPVTMRSMLVASTTPTATTSSALRRLSRPAGAISRRAAVAVRIADPQAVPVARRAVSSMLRVNPAVSILLTLPPTRGMVSFDSVTSRLPAEQQTIRFARGTDAIVKGMPARPTFAITPETVRVDPIRGGTVIDTVLGTRAADLLRARPGIAARRLPDPREPREVPDPVESDDPRGRPRPFPLPARVDSADAAAFRAAAVRHLGLVNPAAPWFFPRTRVAVALNAAAVRPQLRAQLDPAPVLMQRMQATIRLAGDTTPPAIGQVGTTPVFRQPMSEPLASLSQDWLLPGLERVPVDSVAMLEPNQRFIEAFMLGLNVEMGRELLWRDFVVDDPRATFFRRFWRAVNPVTDGEIAPIAEWGARKLSENRAAGASSKQVVLLVRSILFRRYPTAVVYAVPAVPVGNGREPGPIDKEIHPLFRGSLQPDVTFFGFDVDADVATGNPGWYFVIQQQPTEPRFGFDVEIDFGDATHVPLAAPPAGHTLPSGTSWARNSAHMAQITRQQPVRVAIHASELIKAPAP